MSRSVLLILSLTTLLFTGCNSQSGTGTSLSSGAGHGPAVVVDDNNFQQVVLESDVPVLVDFGATWCPPCQAIAPIVGELAADFEGRAVVATLDVDDAAGTAGKHGIQYLPTFIVFHQGKEISRDVGGDISKAKLADRINAVLQ